MTKLEILQQALEAREAEVLEYQINIEIFELTITALRSESDMEAFVQDLEARLSSSKHEQKKAQSILNSIKKLIEALLCTSK